ncbi:MAG: hypothetical protein C5B53_12895 [Candidatus Melainabacteria bacterium]|nr:MAG: hypothetical protein C5B53_12895 [Candidatus Melainabacteria bacterium]
MVAGLQRKKEVGTKSGDWARLGSFVLTCILTAIIFSSCIYSDHPLTPRGTKDDRICGAWRLVDDKNNSQMQLSIEREKDGWYKICEKEQGPGEKEHTSTDRCYPSLTKCGNFLNIEFRVALKQEGKQQTQSVPKFMFVKYTVTKDDLWIWNIDETILMVDIHNRRLVGEIDNASTPWRIVRIHDTASHILDYFNEQAKGTLFVAAGHFKRV